MPKRKKLNLTPLAIQSFVTSLDNREQDEAKGGISTKLCNSFAPECTPTVISICNDCATIGDTCETCETDCGTCSPSVCVVCIQTRTCILTEGPCIS